MFSESASDLRLICVGRHRWPCLTGLNVKMAQFHPSLEGVCQDLLQQDFLLSQQTDSADAIRTPSESSHGSDESFKPGAPLRPAKVWWAQRIIEYAPPPEDRLKPGGPVSIVSGCTGAGAELAAFKAGFSHKGFTGVSDPPKYT